MVQWSEPAAEHSNEFSGFWAQLQNVDNTRKTLSKGNNPQETTFTGLQPGTQYTVEVATTTVGEAQISEIVTAQQYTSKWSMNNTKDNPLNGIKEMVYAYVISLHRARFFDAEYYH